jgi:hypothetical protein
MKKGQPVIYKTLHGKLKTEQHETHEQGALRNTLTNQATAFGVNSILKGMHITDR